MSQLIDDSTSEPATLRARYAAFRQREIEFYKEVVSYRTLMRMVDMARERMTSRGTLALGDLPLAYEVDDIIAERLRLPSFRAWTRRQVTVAGASRGWSARAEQLTLQIPAATAAGAVLLLQPRDGDLWEAVCASGHTVVVVEPDDAERDRVLERAASAHWHDAVTLASAHEDVLDTGMQFSSVVCSPAAFADHADWEVEARIETLKARTLDGGVHVVEGLLPDRSAAPRAVLRRGYASWRRRVQRGDREWTLIATHGG